MVAINLVDSADGNTNYGILLCENGSISEIRLRNKICELKDQLENEESDWIIDDLIKGIPKEWRVQLQEKCSILTV